VKGVVIAAHSPLNCSRAASLSSLRAWCMSTSLRLSGHLAMPVFSIGLASRRVSTISGGSRPLREGFPGGRRDAAGLDTPSGQRDTGLANCPLLVVTQPKTVPPSRAAGRRDPE
jgi:hypothetical protein